MKLCNQCRCEKPETEFYKKKTAKDGLFWWCKDCHRNYVKAKYHKLAESPDYRVAERARVLAFHRENTDKIRAWAKIYAQNNRAKLNANAKKYVLAREQRTPKWLSVDDFWLMEQAYELAGLRTKVFGFAWHVDHVIPLHGRLVSGLHVPHNLQVIPAYTNRSKSNRYDPT